MKTITLLLSFWSFFFFGHSQNTSIPDVNFEKALIDLGYDSGSPDGLVPTIAIKSIGILNISGKNIIDLQGIQDFTALVSLRCQNNNIASLKLTNNKALQGLDCTDNNITDINISENTNIVVFLCDNNALGSLDISKNTKLRILDVNNNQLTSLNVKNGNNSIITNLDARNNPSLTCIEVDDATYSNANWIKIDTQTEFKENCAQMAYIPDYNFEKTLIEYGYDTGNPDTYVPISAIDMIQSLDISNRNIADLSGIEYFSSLEILNCSDNILTVVNLTKNTALKGLSCYNNNLSELNVSQNINLLNLTCYNNSITSLDVLQNVDLSVLNCSNNNLTTLDLTQNNALFRLYCNDNSLNSLNIKNGNNTFINRFNARNNLNLTCIDVDDKAYSTANWIEIDSQAGFSETCGSLGIDNFLSSNISVYPNPTDAFITFKLHNSIKIENISTFNSLGKQLNKTQNNSLDLSQFKSGLYFIKIKTNQGPLTKKVIKI